MKRFTGTELAALALAAVLILGGVSLVIWPESRWVPHQGSALGAGSITAFDRLTPVKSRMLGVTAMAFGVGLGAIICRGKR